MSEPREIMTVLEAADYLRVSERTVRQRVADRAIAHVREGDRVLFRLEDLRDYMRAKRQPAANEVPTDRFAGKRKKVPPPATHTR